VPAVRWSEVAFTVPEAAAELWAAALVEAGAGGVEERDATTLARPAAGQVTLVVWVEPDGVDAFLRDVDTTGLPEAMIERRDRDEDEWRDAWKKYFGVTTIGDFVLIPSWEKHTPGPAQIPLALDPGRAFGTGGHASTRLCLKALSGPAPRRVLDVGCGSGILIIAALKRWPEAQGWASDIDLDAVAVARENAERNGVAPVLSTEMPDGEFDLILANIQPEVLIPMAPELARRLVTGGRMLLSGILVEAAAEVVAAYRAQGLTVDEGDEEQDWRLVKVGR
jgi:ribosomal protein L11 methyltransferase